MAAYKIGAGHALTPLGKTGYSYCYRCMAVALKNKATRTYFRKPCRNSEGWT